ncbi:MAG: extracellular solute-binding protein, partial [Dehalococcoidia bacterium]|nr:extracellular solute-binding protein [Dehalococcoidia bacterium]
MDKPLGKHIIAVILAVSVAAMLLGYEKAEAQWESEWQKTLEAAKKEGKVVIYTTAPGKMRKAMESVFKAKFQIDVEVSSFRGGQAGGKVLSERNAGLYVVDAFVGGSTTATTQLKPAGALDPLDKLLVLPEVTNTKLWYQGNLRWIDPAHTLLMFLGFPVPNLLINTNMVKQEELKSYKNLLEPRWKGKIVMNDPTIPGTASKGFAVIGWHLMNLDYWRELAKQEPVLTRNQRLQIEWVARGKYPILLFPQSSMTTEFIRAGSPIASFTPAEGSYLTGGSGNIAIMNRAPHPNAAKIYINWLLSREGQTVFTQAFGRQSLRVDVGTEGLDPVALRQPDGKYFLGMENEEFLS